MPNFKPMGNDQQPNRITLFSPDVCGLDAADCIYTSSSLSHLNQVQQASTKILKMFHQLSKHLEFRQNTPLRDVFSTLFLVFGCPDETLSPVFLIYYSRTSIIRIF